MIVPFRVYRAWANLRCRVGVHRLSAWAWTPADSPDAIPMNPRGRPGPGDRRRCEHCGVRWHGAYDGIAPYWQRDQTPASMEQQS